MSIVPSLFSGQCLVTLHSDQDQVCRGAEYGTNASSKKTGLDSLEGRQVLAIVYSIFEIVIHREEDTQSDCGVDGLSHQS